MFHDAPVEAVSASVRVHAPSTLSREDLVEHYSLRSRVLPFLLLQQEAKFQRALAQADAGEIPAATESTSFATHFFSAAYIRAALQFPDSLLHDSVAVLRATEELLLSDPSFTSLQHRIEAAAQEKERASLERKREGEEAAAAAGAANSTSGAAAARYAALANRTRGFENPNKPVRPRLVVLADTTFGSCCPDEITAQHYDSDCIVHFGDACMSRSTRLPVLYTHRAFSLTPGAAGASAADHCLIAALVLHLRRQLADRLGSAPSCATVSAVLSVVGTYDSRELLCAARERLIEIEAETETEGEGGERVKVSVDWALYPQAQPAASASAAGIGVTAEVVRSDAEAMAQHRWNVNGVTVAQLSPAACRRVCQHFLFVGPAGAPHVLHLHQIHLYNAYHASEAVREALEEGSPLLGPVSVVDEGFLSSSRALPQAEGLTAANAEAVLAAVLESQPSALLASPASAEAPRALQRRLRQRNFNMETLRVSDAVGILVASLAIEHYQEVVRLLHRLLRLKGKRSYVLYVGHLNEYKLANFADTVDCFVVIACPNSRVSHFPAKDDNFLKPVLTPVEVLLALAAPADGPEEREEEGENDSGSDDCARSRVGHGMPAAYTTSFDEVLPALRAEVQRLEEARGASDEGRADNKLQQRQQQQQQEEQDAGSRALVRGVSGGAVAVHRGGGQGALARLHEKSYTGLQPRMGETAVQQSVAEGKHGIARGYAAERESQGV